MEQLVGGGGLHQVLYWTTGTVQYCTPGTVLYIRYCTVHQILYYTVLYTRYCTVHQVLYWTPGTVLYSCTILYCTASIPLPSLVSVVKSSSWVGDPVLEPLLAKLLPRYCTALYYTVLYYNVVRLCARYLYLEKRRNGALNPVANFHIRYCTLMYYTVLYCTVLYCTVLY